MLKRMRSFFILAFLMLATGISAQVTTAGMDGKVSAGGEAIIGATVQAVHEPTGTRYGTITNVDGLFNLQGMRVGGPYKVEVSYIGYQTAVYTGINLQLGDAQSLNVELLESSEILGEVVVIGYADSNMKSDRSGAITNLNAKAISSTPSISRSLNDLIRMTPQASIGGNGASIGGGNYRQSFVTVDGAAFNNAFGIGQNVPSSGSPISLDALEEISISVTPYDVRQSGFNGASINAVTRSGSNEISASFYTYLNNENFKGNKVDGNEFTKSKSEYNLYGFRIGGPILKNKLFFFVNYEQEKSVEPGPTKVAATPEKPFDRDNNPNVARPTVTEMNTIRDYLINKYAYDPGAYQGYSSDSPGHKLLARLDWNINDNHKLSVRYSDTKMKSPSNPSSSTTGLAGTKLDETRSSIYALNFKNARYYQESNFRSFAAELNSAFMGGKINNLFRVSYSHQDEPRTTDGGFFPFVDIGKDNKYFTSFGTELFSYGNLRDVKTTNITDEFSYSINSHKLLVGVQFEHNITKNGFQRFGAGYYQYNTWEDFINDTPQQFAITHSMKSDFSQAYPEFKFQQFSLYLQDEITVNDRLRVQAGVRFELPIYPSLNTYNEQVANTYVGNSDPRYPTLLKKYDTTTLPSTKVMFSPRIGFNYDLLGDRSVVLRGGTGLFTGRLPFVWIVGQASDSGVLQTTYTAVQGDGKTMPSFTTDRQEMLNQIYPNGITSSLPNVTFTTVMDEKLKMPQTWKTSLAVDVKLPWGIKGSLEAIYNKDINPAIVRNVGLKEPVYSNIPDYFDNRPVYGPTYDAILKDVYVLTNADKAGYYYSLTAKLEKAFDFGLSAMVSYTHSGAKSLNDGVGDQIGSAWSNPYTVNGGNSPELGYTNYVMPHRIIAALSFRKEYIKHLATSISLFYEGGSRNRVSPTYSSAIVNDGRNGRNLLYIPKTKDELTFADVLDDKGTVTYSAAQQAEDFWAYVENSSYLKRRKGKYVERNGVLFPWVHTFDLKITQDVFTNIMGKRNTIQVGLDILNIGNLLKSSWGNQWQIMNRNYSSEVLKQVNSRKQGGTDVPVYQFQKRTKDYERNIGYASTYSMQLSIRYIFN